MESTEKDLVIEKVKDMPVEQVSKVLIFIAGLEAGVNIETKSKSEEGGISENVKVR